MTRETENQRDRMPGGRRRIGLAIAAVAIALWAAYAISTGLRHHDDVPPAHGAAEDAAISHLLAESESPFAPPPAVVRGWKRELDQGPPR